MAPKRYHYAFDEAKHKRFLREGRGLGELESYIPWVQVDDVPSEGMSYRAPSWTVDRLCHFLSTLELHGFYVAEWAPQITDIREQYPLALEETLDIAKRHGLKHPVDPHTKYNWVMTTDLLLTVSRNGAQILLARTIKEARDLKNRRTLEKLEIERRYWEKHKVNWGIWTDQTISRTLAHNVGIVHKAYFLPESLEKEVLLAVRKVLTSLVQEHSFRPLSRLALECDQQLGQPLGTSLRVAYYLIATRQWRINMRQLLHPSQPLALLGVALRDL